MDLVLFSFFPFLILLVEFVYFYEIISMFVQYITFPFMEWNEGECSTINGAVIRSIVLNDSISALLL